MARHSGMKVRFVVAGVYFTALVFTWACFWGDMVRGDMSPWVWEDFPSHVRKFGQGDALFGVAMYLLFYSGGFAFPYLIVRGTATVLLNPDATDNPRHVVNGIKAGSFLIATGVCVTFLVLLRAIVAFFANLPTDTWNGWLLILLAPLAAFLLLAGVMGLRNAKKTCE